MCSAGSFRTARKRVQQTLWYLRFVVCLCVALIIVSFLKFDVTHFVALLGGYLLGAVSWVDLFLAPILADLLATADATTSLVCSATVNPHLYQWFQQISALPAFKATHSGSLPHMIESGQLALAAAPVDSAANASGAKL